MGGTLEDSLLVRSPLPLPWKLDERRLLALTLLIAAAVLALRFTSGDRAADGVLFLLVAPIALVAIGWGLRAGLIASVVALAASVAITELTETHLRPLGYVSRAVALFVAGGLVGYGVDQLRRERELARRAAESLAASEEQFRLMVEAVEKYAIFRLSPGGLVETWNAGAERLKGYAPEEIIGRHFEVFYAPGEREREVPEDNLRAARLGYYAGEGWRVRKDGSRFWASVTITALFDETGALTGFSKVVHDITERRDMEEQLRCSLHDRETILNAAGEGICRLDSRQRIMYLNPAAADMFGYDPHELVGKPCHQTVHHSRHDGTRYPEDECPILGTLVRPEIRHFENECFWRKDGTSFPVEYTAAPIKEGDAITGCVLVFDDVSERKEMEERLRRGRAQLARAERIARMGSWEWDFSSDRVSWSLELHRLLGRPPEELGGSEFAAGEGISAFLEQIHPDDRKRVSDEIARMPRAPGMPLLEARAIPPGGEVISVELKADLIRDANDAPTHLIAAVRDVTALRQVDQVFHHAEERFSSGFDYPPVGMCLAALEPERGGRILRVDSGLPQVIRRESRELVGLPVSDLLSGDEDEAADLTRFLSGELPAYSGGHRVELPSGEERTLTIHGWVLDHEEEGPRYAVLQMREATPAAAASIRELPGTLTPRELEMLHLVAEGKSGPDIAATLYLSPDTVKGYLSSLYRKLGVNERAAAVAVGMRAGVIE